MQFCWMWTYLEDEAEEWHDQFNMSHIYMSYIDFHDSYGK